MKPTINSTTFGSITIDGTTFEHDIIIRDGSKVEKRKKKLSKAIYGTSHILSLDEAKYIYTPTTRRIIIGSGQDGNVTLSPEAAAYFERKNCRVELFPTPTAIRAWNAAPADALSGLFHVTC